MTMKTILSIFFLSIVLSHNLKGQQIRGAQADYNITGTGARAEGFGGAFIGVADDATAITWNPGGLTQLERVELSLVGRQASNGSKLTSSVSPSQNNSQTHLSLNSASIVFPFTLKDHKIVFAAAFQRQFDLNSDKTDVSGDVETREAISGGVDNVSTAVAYKFGKFVSAGVSANYWFGKPASKYKEARVSTNEIYYAQSQHDDYFGYNFNSGILLDFNSSKTPLKIGLSVRTPFTLNSETSYDGAGRYYTVWGGNPNEDYSFTYDITQKIHIPMMIGLGSSYQFGENFIVSADYELRKFAKSKNKVLFSTRSVDGEGNVAIYPGDFSYNLSESKKDLNQFRVGAEYLWVNDFAVIPVRAGFRTLPTLTANSTYDGTNTKRSQTSGNAISLGLGLIMSSFALDVAYTISGYTVKNNSTDPLDSYTSKEKFTKNYLTSSVIIYF